MVAAEYFGVLDYVFMGLYVMVLVGLGFYLKRRASESIEDYIIGGRKVPWYVMGISGMAQFLDLTGTALIISFLFMLGPQGLYIEFRGGAVLVLVCMMLWTGKWTRRSGCLTGAEWNIFRFGDCWGGRFAQLMSVFAMVVFTTGMLAYLTKGVGLFLSSFLPFSPEICAYGLIALAAVYTMVSGFYGVVFTDLFQGIIILTAVAYICIKAFLAVAGPGEVAEVAMQVTNNPNWMGSVPQWKASMPRGYEQYSALVPLMLFYLFRSVLGGASNTSDPKFFGAKTDRECCKIGVLWTMMMTFRWPMMMGIAVLGLFLMRDLFPDISVLEPAAALVHQHFPEVTRPEWGALISGLANNPENYAPALVEQLQGLLGDGQYAEKMQLLSFDGTINPEKILPAVLLMGVTEGLRGVLVLALIAASMSTFDSNVNMATGMVMRDVYQKYIRPQASTREIIYAGWATVALLVVFGVALANSVDSINDIWGWIIMGLSGGFLVPGLLRLYWWRFNGLGTAVGTLAGMTAAIVQRIFWPEMGEIMQLVYALSTGMVAGVVATFCAPPTDPEVLRNFYMKTRPFGVWGRLKRQLPDDERKKVTQEHIRDISTAPFAILWQVNMFVAPMLLVIHSFKAFAGSLTLWLIGGAGMYFIWYRHLPEGNFYED